MMLKFLKTKKSKKNTPISWEQAPDIDLRIKKLLKDLQLDWIDEKCIYTLRSYNANTRAYARIWGLPRIWQMVLDDKPKYIIEVISEKFDKVPTRKQDEILIHELVHIPRNFSGALVAHTRKGKGSFKDKLDKLLVKYNN